MARMSILYDREATPRALAHAVAHGGLVVNYAYVATDPIDLYRAEYPVGRGHRREPSAETHGPHLR